MKYISLQIKKHQTIVALTFILITYFSFGLHHLGQFVTADEHYWVYERIPQYWQALHDHKWTKTFINDKPGVSLALVSGIGILQYPESETHCEESTDKIISCTTETTSGLYTTFRLPILILSGLLLVLLFFLVSQIASRFVALWTTTLTALSPILLGMSQIVNPDALLWSSGAIGIFSFLAYLEKREWKYIAITAIATGLALLSKYSAIVLLPAYILFAAAFFLVRKGSDDKSDRAALLASSATIAAIAAGSIAMLCFFLPALLINDKYVRFFLETIPHKTIFGSIAAVSVTLFIIDTVVLKNKLFFGARALLLKNRAFLRSVPIIFLSMLVVAAATRIAFPQWDIFSRVPFDMKDFENARYYGVTINPFEALILEWQPILFSLTPVALLGAAAFLFLPTRDNKHQFFSLALPIFIVSYLGIFFASGVLVTPRYSILLYPLFAFLAALGFDRIADSLGRYRYARMAFILLIPVASLLSLASVRPFYINYSNILLPQKALISDSWGYGGYEAAAYLNSLPDAKNLTVWSDYYGVCEFFVGRCLTAYNFDSGLAPDYYVLTRRGGIRYMSRWDRWEEKSGLIAYKYYTAPDPAWQIAIDGRPENFVKVIKVR